MIKTTYLLTVQAKKFAASMIKSCVCHMTLRLLVMLWIAFIIFLVYLSFTSKLLNTVLKVRGIFYFLRLGGIEKN